jgi:hypothetical protein
LMKRVIPLFLSPDLHSYAKTKTWTGIGPPIASVILVILWVNPEILGEIYAKGDEEIGGGNCDNLLCYGCCWVQSLTCTCCMLAGLELHRLGFPAWTIKLERWVTSCWWTSSQMKVTFIQPELRVSDSIMLETTITQVCFIQHVIITLNYCIFNLVPDMINGNWPSLV